MAPSQDDSDHPKYLTTRQAAARIGVTINAIKAWIREQRLPALRTPGGHHRIAEVDLAAFQARLAEGSTAEPATRARVLIADDDKALAAALREALAVALPDALIQIASDGYEALVQVGAFRPDVLVLDIRMPRLDGFEVCRRLKSGRDTERMGILAVTAYPTAEVRQDILDCGADAFLAKPIDVEEFRSGVRALLSAKR